MKELACVALSGFLALSSRSPGWASNEGVIGVENPAKAPSSKTVLLHELWRVGDDDPDGFIFGRVADVVVDTNETTYVLDSQLCHVAAFAQDGSLLRTFGREGEGPGEFRSPLGLVLLDGAVAISMVQPPRLIRFDPHDGSYAGNLNLFAAEDAPFQRIGSVDHRGDTLAAETVDVRYPEGFMEITNRLVRFAPDGRALSSTDPLVTRFDYANFVVHEQPHRFWTLTGDGHIVSSSSFDYEIDVFGPDGEHLVVTRAYEHVGRSTKEKEEVRTYYEEHGARGATIHVSDHERDIAWIDVDDDGRLWVLSSRGRLGLARDSMGVFDVFDAQGRLTETVELKGEGNPLTDKYFLAGDRVIVVRRHRSHPEVDDPGPTEVIAYAMQ